MINQIIESIDSVTANLDRLPELVSLSRRLDDANAEEINELLDLLIERSESVDQNSIDEFFHAVNPVMLAMARRDSMLATSEHASGWPPDRLQKLLSLYHRSPQTAQARNAVLFWLASSTRESWNHDRMNAWAGLLSNDPPGHRSTLPLAFAPAMDAKLKPDRQLLERLLNEGLQHLQVAPAVLDLLNFYVRHDQLDSHPAAPRAPALAELLGQLAGQLGKIEEGQIEPDADPQQIGQQVSDAVALIVSICDTLAQTGFDKGIPKLNQAAALRHRRVQTEAAAAMTRLGDEQGRSLLIGLAAEPVARLRVLSYAEELGLIEDISLENRGEIAIAESHLAIWLSGPEQMGIAPSRIALVDNREMYWPGYEHPVQCFLFKYGYGLEERPYENIAICGPMTHAFPADLTHLSHEDIYALFAGWQTVHEEIFQMPPERAADAFPGKWSTLTAGLRRQEEDPAERVSEANIEFAGRFFGRLALAASCKHSIEGRGTMIVDEDQHWFFPAGSPTSPIDARLAFAIWQGRQLLSTFNPAS